MTIRAIPISPASARPRLVSWLATLRAAPWWLLILALSADFASTVWVCLFLPSTVLDVLRFVTRSTDGIVSANFLVDLLDMLVIVGGVILGVGRMAPRDLGLDSRDIVSGMIFAVCVWAASIVCLLAATIIEGGVVALDPRWTQEPGRTVGHLLAAGGAAAIEEAVFRGLVLTQLGLRFTRAFPSKRRTAIAAAFAISAALFSAGHVPYLLHEGTPPGQYAADLLAWFGYGALFGIVYLRARNLFCAIAVHALILAPPLLEGSSGAAETALFLIVGCWLVIPVLREVSLRRTAERHKAGA